MGFPGGHPVCISSFLNLSLIKAFLEFIIYTQYIQCVVKQGAMFLILKQIKQGKYKKTQFQKKKFRK